MALGSRRGENLAGLGFKRVSSLCAPPNPEELSRGSMMQECFWLLEEKEEGAHPSNNESLQISAQNES